MLCRLGSSVDERNKTISSLSLHTNVGCGFWEGGLAQKEEVVNFSLALKNWVPKLDEAAESWEGCTLIISLTFARAPKIHGRELPIELADFQRQPLPAHSPCDTSNSKASNTFFNPQMPVFQTRQGTTEAISSD